ncbi:MAG TPA: hypothetical protein VKY27_03450 [Bacteriovoracaceae bacterium]|nr:hypothetical protein [Bacteriovoracaceae bacterium]
MTILAHLTCPWYSLFMHYLLFLVFLLGCSGYRYGHPDNPLSQYGINSLSVPMFYNYSNLPAVGPEFTQQTYLQLMSFSGLKLNNGYSNNTDAVLLGIIRSPEKLTETLRAGSIRVAKSKAPDAIGDKRQAFYIPGNTRVILYLQVVLIRKPTEEEISLFHTEISPQIPLSSRVILNEMIPLSDSFVREVMDREGTQVIATQNSGILRKKVKSMAESAAETIRDLILYAF